MSLNLGEIPYPSSNKNTATIRKLHISIEILYIVYSKFTTFSPTAIKMAKILPVRIEIPPVKPFKDL